MYLTYYSEFVSRADKTWRIEIYTGTQPTVVHHLSLPADNPLAIEWDETDKLAPVWPSRATLTVESKTDRMFLPLATSAPGSVRLDVLADSGGTWQLYWRGTLDPELYEEPYTRTDGYDVRLTFCDLALLARIPFSPMGRTTWARLVDSLLPLAALELPTYNGCKDVKLSANALLYEPEAPVEIPQAYICTDNFAAHDGEPPMNCLEVLEQLLRPFNIRLMQWAGTLRLDSLGHLCGQETAQLEWAGTDATLSMDRTYRRVVANFAPGAVTSTAWSEDYEQLQLEVEKTVEFAAGWDLLIGTATDGRCMQASGSARHFKLRSHGGTPGDMAGVLLYFEGYDGSGSTGTTGLTGAPAATTPRLWWWNVGGTNTSGTSGGGLRLHATITCDTRTDPWNDLPGTAANRWNGQPIYDVWQKERLSRIDIPVRVSIWSQSEGGELWEQQQMTLAFRSAYVQEPGKTTRPGSTGGTDLGNMQYTEPGGTISSDKLRYSTAKGEPLSGFGTMGGYVQVEVMQGCRLWWWNGSEEVEMPEGFPIEWLMLHEVRLEVCSYDGTTVAGDFDVQYSAEANSMAEEELEQDFTIGTSDKLRCPTGTGYTLRNMGWIPQAYNPQRRWITLAAAQYGQRGECLGGTARLNTTHLTFTDRAMDGDIRLMAVSRRQNLIADEEEIKAVRLFPCPGYENEE